MRIKKYLNEARIKDVIFKIKRDCDPFLKEMKGSKYFFYRGTTKLIDVIRKYKPRKNRRPTDSSLLFHNIMDNAFKEKFGWKSRSEGVFATSDENEEYGDTSTIFFPIGKYKYIWSSSIKDLYEDVEGLLYILKDNYHFQMEHIKDIDIKSLSTYSYNLRDIEGLKPYLLDLEGKKLYHSDWNIVEIRKILEIEAKKEAKNIANQYTDKNLKKAATSENEVMFKCNEYYILNMEKIKDSTPNKLLKELL